MASQVHNWLSPIAAENGSSLSNDSRADGVRDRAFRIICTNATEHTDYGAVPASVDHPALLRKLTSVSSYQTTVRTSLEAVRRRTARNLKTEAIDDVQNDHKVFLRVFQPSGMDCYPNGYDPVGNSVCDLRSGRIHGSKDSTVTSPTARSPGASQAGTATSVAFTASVARMTR